MMALGSAIGTGLFIGTGAAIRTAGPAVLLSFLVACVLLVLVMRALGEMAAADPSPGAFSTYAEKAMGRTVGRTLGWLWWAQIVVVVAAEATAAAQLLARGGDRSRDLVVGRLSDGARRVVLPNVDGVDSVWTQDATHLGIVAREGRRLTFRLIDMRALTASSPKTIAID